MMFKHLEWSAVLALEHEAESISLPDSPTALELRRDLSALEKECRSGLCSNAKDLDEAMESISDLLKQKAQQSGAIMKDARGMASEALALVTRGIEKVKQMRDENNKRLVRLTENMEKLEKVIQKAEIKKREYEGIVRRNTASTDEAGQLKKNIEALTALLAKSGPERAKNKTLSEEIVQTVKEQEQLAGVLEKSCATAEEVLKRE